MYQPLSSYERLIHGRTDEPHDRVPPPEGQHHRQASSTSEHAALPPKSDMGHEGGEANEDLNSRNASREELRQTVVPLYDDSEVTESDFDDNGATVTCGQKFCSCFRRKDTPESDALVTVHNMRVDENSEESATYTG